MKYLQLLLLLFILAACSSDDDSQPIVLPDPGLNLDKPSIGQGSTFVRLEGNCGWSENFQYTNDTLEVKVIKQGDGLFLQESFTEGSPLYETNSEPVTYPIFDHDGFLVIPERQESALFFFYGNDTLFTRDLNHVTATQEECTPMVSGDVFRGDDIAFIEELKIHDIALYNHTIISCVPVIFDLEAYLCYTNGELNLSYTLDSGFPGLTLNAWKRIDR